MSSRLCKSLVAVYCSTYEMTGKSSVGGGADERTRVRTSQEWDGSAQVSDQVELVTKQELGCRLTNWEPLLNLSPLEGQSGLLEDQAEYLVRPVDEWRASQAPRSAMSGLPAGNESEYVTYLVVDESSSSKSAPAPSPSSSLHTFSLTTMNPSTSPPGPLLNALCALLKNPTSWS